MTWSLSSGLVAATNYESQVAPILREHCVACHNQQKKSSGLALDTYASVIEGGASGEVVYGGDLASSRLWALVNHDEEPAMPPNQDKLPADKLQVLRQWIEDGLLERTGSAPAKRGETMLTLAPSVADDASAPGAMPNGILQQPITSTSQPGPTTQLALSPRAPLLAIGGWRQIVLYHSETRELLGIVPHLEGQVSALRFSRDASLIVAGGGRPGASGQVALYDVKSGARLATLGNELDTVLAADIDVSLQRVALGGPSKSVRVFATADGQLAYELNKHTDWITALEFSPDGKFLATADRQGGLVIWEAAQGREYQVCQGHPAAITSVSWRSDSQVLATSSEDGWVKLWSPEQVAPVGNVNAHPGGVLRAEFDPQGRWVSCGRDQLVKLWDGNGQPVVALPALSEIGLDAAVDATGKHIVTSDFSGQVRCWSIEPVAESGTVTPYPPRLEDRLAEVRQALQMAEATYQTRSSEAGTLGTQAEQLQGELQVATNQLLAARRELAGLRSAATAGDPPDLSSQEQAVAELERRVGQLTGDSLELQHRLQSLQQGAAEAQRDREAIQARAVVIEAEWTRFEQARAKFLTAEKAAEDQLASVQSQQSVAEDAVHAARKDRQAFDELYSFPVGAPP